MNSHDSLIRQCKALEGQVKELEEENRKLLWQRNWVVEQIFPSWLSYQHEAGTKERWLVRCENAYIQYKKHLAEEAGNNG